MNQYTFDVVGGSWDDIVDATETELTRFFCPHRPWSLDWDADIDGEFATRLDGSRPFVKATIVAVWS